MSNFDISVKNTKSSRDHFKQLFVLELSCRYFKNKSSVWLKFFFGSSQRKNKKQYMLYTFYFQGTQSYTATYLPLNIFFLIRFSVILFKLFNAEVIKIRFIKIFVILKRICWIGYDTYVYSTT